MIARIASGNLVKLSRGKSGTSPIRRQGSCMSTRRGASNLGRPSSRRPTWRSHQTRGSWEGCAPANATSAMGLSPQRRGRRPPRRPGCFGRRSATRHRRTRSGPRPTPAGTRANATYHHQTRCAAREPASLHKRIARKVAREPRQRDVWGDASAHLRLKRDDNAGTSLVQPADASSDLHSPYQRPTSACGFGWFLRAAR